MANNCKYYKEEEYQSLDGGITWTAMGVYRKGDLLEYDSPDCGTPTPTFDGKFKSTYSSGGRTYSAACDGNTTLTTATTKPSGYDYSAMTTAEIGSCVTSIGISAFTKCYSLVNITIPDSVTSIGDYAFYKCSSLTSVNIPSGVTSIGNGVFARCTGLTSIDVPDSVTTISGSAFDFCSGLTSCTIGSGIRRIGKQAFWDCRSLISLTVEAVTPPYLGDTAFVNTPIVSGTGFIYVPAGSVDSYKTANYWKMYANQIQPIT